MRSIDAAKNEKSETKESILATTVRNLQQEKKIFFSWKRNIFHSFSKTFQIIYTNPENLKIYFFLFFSHTVFSFFRTLRYYEKQKKASKPNCL